MPQLPGNEHATAARRAPLTHADRAAIREQMERILESSLFKQSKRYPSVLRYLINYALNGAADFDLKERTIGVEVLGRDPAYDTNTDPTVRVVAGEIRKRLALYYQQPGHESELRIDLPTGSYVPEFSRPAHLEASPVPAPVPTAPLAPVVRPWWSNRTYIAGLVLLAGILLVLGWMLLRPAQTALDLFWDPVLKGAPSVLLCVGERPSSENSPVPESPLPQKRQLTTASPGGPSGPEDTMADFLKSNHAFVLSDVAALTQIGEFLQARGIKHRIEVAGVTSLAALREGPAILIGSYNNYWTLRLTSDMRFRFKSQGSYGFNWIEDRDHPARRDWSMDNSHKYSEVSADYGLITRALDASTGRMVVTLGGLSGLGTFAAEEFVVSPAYLESMAARAPKDWQKRNLEIVITTKLINGNTGPPTVVATHFW